MCAVDFVIFFIKLILGFAVVGRAAKALNARPI
jgi:hypothetical protein